MRHALTCLAFVAVAIAGVWVWLGSPVLMPYPQVGRAEKLYCVSYTPFRGLQTPLDPATMIPAAQIDDDLARLSEITDCVRTYSVDFGLDQIAGIAAKYGLKVMQGLWLSSHPAKNNYQIETAIALANKYPETIRAVVVGNEVLLRGDMTATDLARTIRAVKARVRVPVTYADVWEFWLRNNDIANAVDFVTIHILPYWEDFPVSAGRAGAHVDAIRRQVVDAFPGKEVLIGEVGWPSAGRMREGALPSPVNQARVIQDVLALSKRENFRVNVIEAFDQPWKRALEGTVGGHWGLLDGYSRAPKFGWSQPVSNHPFWIWQGIGGILFAIIILGAATYVRDENARTLQWLGVGANALVGGALVGWTIENIPIEKSRHCRLGAFPDARRSRILGAGRSEHGDRTKESRSQLRAFARGERAARQRTARPLRRGHFDRGDVARFPCRAQSGVRSALPRFSLCTAHRGDPAFRRSWIFRGPRERATRYCGNVGGLRARAVRGLHCLQRNLCQLAVAVGLRGPGGSGFQSGSGARRAKLSTSRPMAREDNPTL